MRDGGWCGGLVGYLSTHEDYSVELPHPPLFVHCCKGGVGLDFVSVHGLLKLSDGGTYISVVSGKGLNDGDVLTHGVLPLVVRGVEKVFYEFRVLEPEESFLRQDGHVLGAFHTFRPVVSVGSHVVVDVDVIGGGVVGNHGSSCNNSGLVRRAWMLDDWIEGARISIQWLFVAVYASFCNPIRFCLHF